VESAPLIAELPFDYRLRYHATVHAVDGGRLLSVLGAPERTLSLCTRILERGVARELTEADRAQIMAAQEGMSEKGLRVIAGAYAPFGRDSLESKDVERLVFVGLYGMQDVLRAEVHDALRRAQGAGLRVVMITGDHKVTARAIAKEAGIWKSGDSILTGEDIASMSGLQLEEALATASVFARVSPEDKLRIVEAYKRRGDTIAMTGDGVNDAPPLVAADLGVAMGTIGTEVAKEAADIVLLDDNFGSIVSAVEEGRSIYRTIKKVILYLFSTSLGEVLTISGALVLGYPLPLLATQIIWLNFVTDGFLTVALAMEPKERDLLQRKFEKPKRLLIDRRMALRMVPMALVMAAGALYIFGLHYESDMEKALTMSLTVLAVFQWFNAWNCRSETDSMFSIRGRNVFLIAMTAVVIVLQLLAVYTPVLQRILHTAPLTLSDWLLIIVIALSIVVVEEARKFVARRQK
jgi:P-type Ca2+ transporter type 2C